MGRGREGRFRSVGGGGWRVGEMSSGPKRYIGGVNGDLDDSSSGGEKPLTRELVALCSG